MNPLAILLGAVLASSSAYALDLPNTLIVALNFIFPDVSQYGATGDQVFILLSKFLLFIAAYALVTFGLSVAPQFSGKEHKKVRTVLSIVVALMGVTLIPSNTVVAIFQTYSWVFAVLALLAPLIVALLMMYKPSAAGEAASLSGDDKASRMIRGILWLMFAYIYGTLATTLVFNFPGEQYAVGQWAEFGAFIAFIGGLINIVFAFFSGPAATSIPGRGGALAATIGTPPAIGGGTPPTGASPVVPPGTPPDVPPDTPPLGPTTPPINSPPLQPTQAELDWITTFLSNARERVVFEEQIWPEIENYRNQTVQEFARIRVALATGNLIDARTKAAGAVNHLATTNRAIEKLQNSRISAAKTLSQEVRKHFPSFIILLQKFRLDAVGPTKGFAKVDKCFKDAEAYAKRIADFLVWYNDLSKLTVDIAKLASGVAMPKAGSLEKSIKNLENDATKYQKRVVRKAIDNGVNLRDGVRTFYIAVHAHMP